MTQSQKYNSGHQVIGIICFITMLLVYPLSFLTHRERRNKSRLPDEASTRAPPTGMKANPVNTASLAIIALTVLLSVISTGTGFNFAIASYYNQIWAPTVVGFFIIVAIIMGVRYMWTRTRRDMSDEIDLMKFGEERDAEIRRAQEDAWRAQEQRQQGGGGGVPPPAYEQGQAGFARAGGVVYPSVHVPGGYGR
jgi:hypothetical protein